MSHERYDVVVVDARLEHEAVATWVGGWPTAISPKHHGSGMMFSFDVANAT